MIALRGQVVTLRGPANQPILRDVHFPPLQAVVANWSFEKLHFVARVDTADKLLVDAEGVPDVLK